MIDSEKTNGDIDTKLMLQVKNDNKEALADLYLRNIAYVIRYFAQIGKADGSSEDLAHEVFSRIWQKRKTFRKNSTFKAFLLGYSQRILKEHQRNLIRDSKLIKKKAISQNQTNPFCPEKAYIYSELLDNIKKCKSKLSEKERESLELLLDRDITHQNASEYTSCSYNTFHQRLFAARKKLKNLLNK